VETPAQGGGDAQPMDTSGSATTVRDDRGDEEAGA
jgi:hypothetical protein